MRLARMLMSLGWSIVVILFATPLWAQDVPSCFPSFLTPDLTELVGNLAPSPSTTDVARGYNAPTNPPSLLTPEQAAFYRKNGIPAVMPAIMPADLAGVFRKQAIALQKDKKLSEAMVSWDKAIQLAPSCASYYEMRAVLHCDLNQYDEASRDANQACKLNFNSPIAWQVLAIVALNQNNWTSALIASDVAIGFSPNTSNNYYLRAIARSKLANLSAAKSDLDVCLKRNPKHVEALKYRGEIRGMAGDYTGAIADSTAAIQLGDPDSTATLGRAQLYRSMQDYPRTITDATTCIENTIAKPSLRCVALRLRGDSHFQLGQFDLSLVDFLETVRIEPDDPTGYLRCAMIWAGCRDRRYLDGPKAVKAATRACELTGWQHYMSTSTLAWAYARCGEFDQAIILQKKALSLPSTFEECVSGELILHQFKHNKPFTHHNQTYFDEPKNDAGFMLGFSYLRSERSGLITFRANITFKALTLHVDLPIGHRVAIRWTRWAGKPQHVTTTKRG